MDSVDTVKSALADSAAFQLYLEDVILRNTFLSELDNISQQGGKGWECFKNKENKWIYTKREEGQNILSVFTKFKIEQNVFLPFAMISEIELMKDWMPGIKKADVIKQAAFCHRGLHMHREMPFPISDRELYICHSSLLIPERKGALVIIRSVNPERNKHWQMEVPPETDKITRAEMVRGFIYIEQIDEKHSWFH